ncbi:hypothetical protein [Streptomyces sp. NRRL F-5123]|nr:hypothetical protein [Streptomyces sp. NRRL F-5123]
MPASGDGHVEGRVGAGVGEAGEGVLLGRWSGGVQYPAWRWASGSPL